MKTIRMMLFSLAAVVLVSGCETMPRTTSADGLCSNEWRQVGMAADAAEGADTVIAQWAVTGSEEVRVAMYRDQLRFAGRMYEATQAALGTPTASAFMAEMQRLRYALERDDLEAVETTDFMAIGARLAETRGTEFSPSK